MRAAILLAGMVVSDKVPSENVALFLLWAFVIFFVMDVFELVCRRR